MADEKYVIEITLDATDATATGFTSAMRKKQALDNALRPDLNLRLALQDNATREALGVHEKLARSLEPLHQVIELKDHVTESAFGMVEKLKGLLAIPFTLPLLITEGAGIEGFVKWPLELAAGLQMSQTNFAAFLGSASAADTLMSHLEETAGRTGFSFEGLRTAESSLLAVGFGADRADKYLHAAMETSARFSHGTEGVEQLAQTFKFFEEQGFFGGRGTINLVSQGVPVFDIFAEKWHTTARNARTILQSANLDVESSLDTISEYLTTHYAGSVERFSNQATGLWERAKYALFTRPFETWGKGLLSAIQPRLDSLMGWLEGKSESVNHFLESLEGFGKSVATWALGPAERFFGTLRDALESPGFRNAPDFFGKLNSLTNQLAGVDLNETAHTLGDIGRILGGAITVGGSVGSVMLSVIDAAGRSQGLKDLGAAFTTMGDAFTHLDTAARILNGGSGPPSPSKSAFYAVLSTVTQNAVYPIKIAADYFDALASSFEHLVRATDALGKTSLGQTLLGTLGGIGGAVSRFDQSGPIPIGSDQDPFFGSHPFGGILGSINPQGGAGGVMGPPLPGAQTATGSTAGADATGGSVEDYIRSDAARFGIDPDTAVRVALSEGGLSSWNAPGDFNSIGKPTSFGPYQLHYGNLGPAGDPNNVAGLGDAFTAATGLYAWDTAAGQAAVDFALQHALGSGWGAEHGAARAGIGAGQGLRGYASGGWLTEPVFGIGQSGRGYSFGERGPEFVSPSGSQGGGGDVHFHGDIVVDGSSNDPLQIANQVMAHLGRMLRGPARNIPYGGQYWVAQP